MLRESADQRGRRRRRSTRALTILAAGAALLLIVSGVLVLAVHRSGPAQGKVALQGTASETGIAPLSELELSGPAGTAQILLAPSPLPRAPAVADLGVFTVTAGRYDQVRVVWGSRSVTAAASVVLPDGGLLPLLVAVKGNAVAAYAGNERVNYGLLFTSGQVTPLPNTSFVDQAGRSVPFDSLHGRITVLTDFETHCHETCPLYTSLFSDLQRVLRARGWESRVNVEEITIDAGRDTPAVLAAYGRMTGATWGLLTADSRSLQAFWSALRISYRQKPYDGAPPLDWYTGQPETYDMDHDSEAVVVDADGAPRFYLQGTPRLGHALERPLARLQSADALRRAGRNASWALTDLLDRIDILMNVPEESERAPEADIHVGSAPPPFTLRDLSGQTVSLANLVGRPVIVNFWATWCVPCRRELPRLAGAVHDHPELTILAVGEGESAGDIRSFLRDVLGDRLGTITPLLDPDESVGGQYSVSGLPVSVFVDAGGVVRAVHAGELTPEVLSQELGTVLDRHGP